MKSLAATTAAALLLCGAAFAQAQSPAVSTATPSRLGTSAKLKQYEVTIRRFDPKRGLESGEDFVLPVNSIDEEHAISSTLANAVSLTAKVQGGEILPVAFCCTKIQEKR